MLLFVGWVCCCCFVFFFFLMIRRPPRSTQSRSSAASDVYKRQQMQRLEEIILKNLQDRSGEDCYWWEGSWRLSSELLELVAKNTESLRMAGFKRGYRIAAVSYTHLRAHETVLDLVCRLLLEKKNFQIRFSSLHSPQFVID
mgnify:CR=1 FL=1